MEAKPDNPPDDLRLLDPFPELVQYANKFNFATMDSTEHSHTPFVVILLQQLEKYKSEVGVFTVDAHFTCSTLNIQKTVKKRKPSEVLSLKDREMHKKKTLRKHTDLLTSIWSSLAYVVTCDSDSW